MISYLALAAAMQAAPTVTPAVRQRPYLGDYFTSEDYPQSALTAREGGPVEVRLTVGVDGRVSNCIIERSTGSAAIDSATCRILRSRARYTPARNAAGVAVPGQDSARLIWFPYAPTARGPAVVDAELVMAPPPPARIAPPAPPPPVLPAPPPPYVVAPQRARPNPNFYFSTDDYPASALRDRAEGTVRFLLIIGPDGRVQNCSVTSSSGNSALDSATCRILRSRARYTPAREVAGNPVAGSDRGSVIWRLPPPPPKPAEPSPAAPPKPA